MLLAPNNGPEKLSSTAIILIALGAVLTLLFLGLPLIIIFAQAFSRGWEVYIGNILHPETLHAIYLTLIVALLVVPLNIAFGLAAAWAVAFFEFPGRKLLITLAELPFSVSPVVAGVSYILVFGSQGLLGPWLSENDIKIVFALPGIVLVTLFVTSPFVFREILPLMQLRGSDEEETAVTLGANGWQIFRRITFPGIRWALLYGAILCSARAIGEFGAVSVVSGNIRGETNTLPLQVELLYNDYNATGAFAAASVLTLLAVVTMVIKVALERRVEK